MVLSLCSILVSCVSHSGFWLFSLSLWQKLLVFSPSLLFPSPEGNHCFSFNGSLLVLCSHVGSGILTCAVVSKCRKGKWCFHRDSHTSLQASNSVHHRSDWTNIQPSHHRDSVNVLRLAVHSLPSLPIICLLTQSFS